VATAISIACSSILAGTALWFSRQYQAEERLEQKARDAGVAKGLILVARYRCHDLTGKALEAVRNSKTSAERDDAITFMGEIDVDCRRVGLPLYRLIDQAKHLSPGQQDSVKKSIDAARRKIVSQSSALGDVETLANESAEDLINIGDLVDVAAGGGTPLTGTGLLNFKKHVDDPSQNELRHAIGTGNEFKAKF